MEKTVLDQSHIEAEVEARLPQPTSSKVSAILNGMGNGATAGVAVYALPRMIAGLRGKPMPEGSYVGTAFATVIGTGLGMWYGLHEAKQLEIYRDKIGQEVIKLRERVRDLEGKPHNHAQQVTAGREAGDDELSR